MLERLPLCAFKLSFETELGNGAWKRIHLASLDSRGAPVVDPAANAVPHTPGGERCITHTHCRQALRSTPTYGHTDIRTHRTHPAANAVSHTHCRQALRSTPTYGHTDIRTHRHTDTPTYRQRPHERDARAVRGRLRHGVGSALQDEKERLRNVFYVFYASARRDAQSILSTKW